MNRKSGNALGPFCGFSPDGGNERDNERQRFAAAGTEHPESGGRCAPQCAGPSLCHRIFLPGLLHERGPGQGHRPGGRPGRRGLGVHQAPGRGRAAEYSRAVPYFVCGDGRSLHPAHRLPQPGPLRIFNGLVRLLLFPAGAGLRQGTGPQPGPGRGLSSGAMRRPHQSVQH